MPKLFVKVLTKCEDCPNAQRDCGIWECSLEGFAFDEQDMQTIANGCPLQDIALPKKSNQCPYSKTKYCAECDVCEADMEEG